MLSAGGNQSTGRSATACSSSKECFFESQSLAKCPGYVLIQFSARKGYRAGADRRDRIGWVASVRPVPASRRLLVTHRGCDEAERTKAFCTVGNRGVCNSSQAIRMCVQVGARHGGHLVSEFLSEYNPQQLAGNKRAFPVSDSCRIVCPAW
jgi:hypothetical protein